MVTEILLLKDKMGHCSVPCQPSELADYEAFPEDVKVPLAKGLQRTSAKNGTVDALGDYQVNMSGLHHWCGQGWSLFAAEDDISFNCGSLPAGDPPPVRDFT